MRRLYYTPLLLLMFMFGQAQNNGGKGISICIDCGFVGSSMDVNVNTVQQLASSSKTYVLLKQKLFSDNKTVAVLSAIAVQELQTKRLLFLVDEQQERIKLIQKWGDKYSVQYGCTKRFEGTVNELLTNNSNPALLLISRTILKQISAPACVPTSRIPNAKS